MPAGCRKCAAAVEEVYLEPDIEKDIVDLGNENPQPSQRGGGCQPVWFSGAAQTQPGTGRPAGT